MLQILKSFVSWRLIKYLFVGGCGYLSHLITLFVCHSVINTSLWLSLIIAMIASELVNYTGYRILVFPDGFKKGDLLRYIIALTVHSIIYYPLVFLFSEILNYLVAAGLCIIIASGIKYIICEMWVWKVLKWQKIVAENK